MKATTNLYVTLELTVEEAKWLHEIMQNPLSFSVDWSRDHEDPKDRKMREAFFEATSIEDWGHGS